MPRTLTFGPPPSLRRVLGNRYLFDKQALAEWSYQQATASIVPANVSTLPMRYERKKPKP